MDEYIFLKDNMICHKFVRGNLEVIGVRNQLMFINVFGPEESYKDGVFYNGGSTLDEEDEGGSVVVYVSIYIAAEKS